MKKLIILLICLICLSGFGLATDWLKFSNKDLQPGTSSTDNYFGSVRALSDSSIWTYGFHSKTWVLKIGNWKSFDIIFHQIGHYIQLYSFNDICDIFLGSKWILNGRNIYRFSEFDSLIVSYPDTCEDCGPISMINDENYLWMSAHETSLMRYDGTNWVPFNHMDSTIDSSRYVTFWEIKKDGLGNIWMATTNFGLFKFDGSNFTRFDTSNSNIPFNDIGLIAIDVDNNVWFTHILQGTSEVVKFDGTNWTVYDSTNSPLPGRSDPHYLVHYTDAIFNDNMNNIWVSSMGHVYKITNNQWTVFDSTNSPIEYFMTIYEFSQDVYGNLWMATDNGLLVYKEGGVYLPGITSVTNEGNDSPGLIIKPNPGNEEVSISLEGELDNSTRLIITDIEGREILSRMIDENIFDLNTETFKNGTYFVKITSKGLSKSGKFVISR